MNAQIRTLIASVGLVASFGLWTAKAQATDTLTVRVPFQFYAQRQSLAAGQYRVRTSPGSGVFQIIDMANGHSTLLMSHPGSSNRGFNQPKLQFHCLGDRCFLSGIQMPETETIYQTTPTPLEKELRRGGGKELMAWVPLSR